MLEDIDYLLTRWFKNDFLNIKSDLISNLDKGYIKQCYVDLMRHMKLIIRQLRHLHLKVMHNYFLKKYQGIHKNYLLLFI